MQDEFITLQEAERILEVSRFTIWRLIRDGELVAYQSPADRRRKLVKRQDVESLKRPKALDPKLAA
jgi:excisionase family DNA binding protein